jgi:hypothetical protein
MQPRESPLGQLLWSAGCLVLFMIAVWFGYTQLGRVAGRSVIIVGSAGIALSLLTGAVAAAAVARGRQRQQAEASPAGAAGPAAEAEDSLWNLAASAAWMAAFCASTVLIGLLPSLVLLSLPVLWRLGGLSLSTAAAIVVVVGGFLWALSTFLNLHLPTGLLLRGIWS